MLNRFLSSSVLLCTALLLAGIIAHSQPRPAVEREFRAVWVATVDNIDFPSKKGLAVEQQKTELLAILDLARRLRLNAVIFQVRPMADALYKSKLEPWSEFLTGEMGKSQSFDPLKFLVTEAHKRGILVHAWFNPYRAYHPAAKTMSANHVSKTQPSLVHQYGRYMWLDPSDPAAQQYSLRVISDVVRRYDIDGVHFDDYFYPYAEKDAAGNKIDFPDDKNWNDYLKTAAQMSETSGVRRIPLSRDDWRRSNVDTFIEAVAREIKREKPHVVFGISPFGIWQPDAAAGITGFNSYKELYSDSRKWLRDGTVDYLSPQLYWETARVGQSFPVLLDWWRAQNVKHRFIWPGIAAYRIGSTPTFSAKEIGSQIDLTRKDSSAPGAIFFSLKSLRNDLGGIQSRLDDSLYRRDAITPAFTWISNVKPSPPRVKIDRGSDVVRVKWSERGPTKAFWFVVYREDDAGWSYSVVPAATRAITISGASKIKQVEVTSVDRLGNESSIP